jgi:hypothetical protein
MGDSEFGLGPARVSQDVAVADGAGYIVAIVRSISIESGWLRKP